MNVSTGIILSFGSTLLFFVGQFLQSTLDWSVRCGTRAAAHLPSNASELCKRSFFRIVHLVNMYDIPARLRINMDQTGIGLMMTRNKTYEAKGSRQVDIHATDEKRAYTLCVASTPDVWSGSTARSLPDSNAIGMDEALEFGFQFTFAASKKKTSHFSTLKTMKEWMVNILKPWIDRAIKDLKLPADQKAILFIDCYPVHTGEEFRVYVFKDFPHIFLIFVPANCKYNACCSLMHHDLMIQFHCWQVPECFNLRTSEFSAF
ncbi:hypothetical protein GGU11DRAFT_819129 [Lentinula aff. detonsa]|nr:hypothetical protein GGU11DRAFT_819129 [Lentinula aff. detonsa]